MASARAGARGIVELPLRRSALGVQLALAEAAAGYEEALRARCARLEKTLEQRHMIESATRKMAEELAVSPDEAYRRLRSLAMSSRKSIASLAEEIAQGG